MRYPELGVYPRPANTTDVSEGLGIFAPIGKFAMDYAIHITVFFAVMVIVVLNARGSWARSNQRSEEAAESRRNVKESINGQYVDYNSPHGSVLYFLSIYKEFYPGLKAVER